MLTYLFDLTICWTLLYGVFYLCMRRETFFKINRWYLLIALLLGLAIPLLRFIPLMETAELYNRQVAEYIPIVYVIKDTPTIVAHTITEQSFEWGQIFQIGIWTLYAVGCFFFLFRFAKGLSSIYKLYQQGEKTISPQHTLIKTSGNHLPFSFLKMIFVSKTLPLNEDYNRILTHELEHVHARHSIDVLILEIINIVFWFHPMIYIYKSAIRQTHEYLADAAVCGSNSRQLYGQLLLRQSLSGLEIALAHHFFNSHIKKRINMIYQEKSGRKAWLKYALAVPALALLMLVFTSHHSLPELDDSNSNTYNDIPIIQSGPLGPTFNFFLDDEFQNKYRGVHIQLKNKKIEGFGIHGHGLNPLKNLLYPEGLEIKTESQKFHLYQNDQNEWEVEYQSKYRGEVEISVKDKDLKRTKIVSFTKSKQSFQFSLSSLKIASHTFQLEITEGGDRIDMGMITFHNSLNLSRISSPEDSQERTSNRIPEKKLSKAVKRVLSKDVSDEEKILQLQRLYNEWLTQYPKESLTIKDVMSWTGVVNRRRVGFTNAGKLVLRAPFYHLPGTPEYLEQNDKVNLSNMILPSYEEIEERLERTYETEEISFLHLYLEWQGFFFQDEDARINARKLFERYASEHKINLGFDLDDLNIQYEVTSPTRLERLIEDKVQPLFWGIGSNTKQFEDNFDLKKSIGMFAYLPPVQATQIFGKDGSNGFVAMSFYTIGDQHPFRARKQMKAEVENFFSTIQQAPESSWVDLLKKIQRDLNNKYEDKYDFYDPITPFSTIAHKHNITLVFKDGEIIKAYRGDGNSTDRIDKDQKVESKSRNSKTGNIESGNILNDNVLSQPFIKSVYENFVVPQDLRVKGVEGAVVILLNINKDNRVTNYRVAHSLDDRFSIAANDALKACESIEVLDEPKNVNLSKTYAINFIIEHDGIANSNSDSLLSIVQENSSIEILDGFKIMYYFESTNNKKGRLEKKSKSTIDENPKYPYIIGGLLTKPRPAPESIMIANGKIIKDLSEFSKPDPKDRIVLTKLSAELALAKYPELKTKHIIEVTTKKNQSMDLQKNAGNKKFISNILNVSNTPVDLVLLVNSKLETNPDENINPNDILSLKFIKGEEALAQYPKFNSRNIVLIKTKNKDHNTAPLPNRFDLVNSATDQFDTITTYNPDTYEETIEIRSSADLPEFDKKNNSSNMFSELKQESFTYDLNVKLTRSVSGDIDLYKKIGLQDKHLKKRSEYNYFVTMIDSKILSDLDLSKNGILTYKNPKQLKKETVIRAIIIPKKSKHASDIITTYYPETFEETIEIAEGPSRTPDEDNKILTLFDAQNCILTFAHVSGIDTTYSTQNCKEYFPSLKGIEKMESHITGEIISHRTGHTGKSAYHPKDKRMKLKIKQARNQINISYKSLYREEITVYLYDLSLNLIKSKTIMPTYPETSITLDSKGLQEKIYFVGLDQGGRISSSKVKL